MYGDQSFRIEMTPEDQKTKLADELADVMWVVTCLANQTGIDLTEAIQKNLDKKNFRDASRHLSNPKLSSNQ
jgi:NTP pyrophosphatase (non-canonical NTP hydrolase)